MQNNVQCIQSIILHSKSVVYQPNIGIVKKYNDTFYKLISFRSLRQKGYCNFGSDKLKVKVVDDRPWKVGKTEKVVRLSQSISRTKSRIFEIAICNDWDYFVTLTLSAEHFDRYNLKEYIRSLGKWLNNYNCRKNADVRYLLIPEQHKDGAWHIHGLISGLPVTHLTKFTLQDHIPNVLRDLIIDDRTIYNWSAYAHKFGWVTLEAIRDKEKISGYITKYITKDVVNTSVGSGNKLYYCSHGLNRATELYRSEIEKAFMDFDFKNDYVAVKVFDNIQDCFSSVFNIEDVEVSL